MIDHPVLLIFLIMRPMIANARPKLASSAKPILQSVSLTLALVGTVQIIPHLTSDNVLLAVRGRCVGGSAS